MRSGLAGVTVVPPASFDEWMPASLAGGVL